MTQEQNAKLLQAYRAAIEAEQYGIADALEDVILEEMDGGIDTIKAGDYITTARPYWSITPLRVPNIDTTKPLYPTVVPKSDEVTA